MQQRWFEIILGGFVLVVALWFLSWALQNSSDSNVISNQKIAADFQSIKGLKIGNDVRIGGVKIGAVDRLSVNPNNFQARVIMALRGDLKLPVDSTVTIISDGLLGGAYVRLKPGQSDEIIADGGELTRIQESLSLEELLGKAIFIISETSSQ